MYLNVIPMFYEIDKSQIFLPKYCTRSVMRIAITVTAIGYDEIAVVGVLTQIITSCIVIYTSERQ
jgi:hypothetical protein